MRLIVWKEKTILRINIKILFFKIYLLKLSLALIHFLNQINPIVLTNDYIHNYILKSYWKI